MIIIKNNINKITVKGHAGYAPHGFDIVCGGVSVLLFTLIESMNRLTKDKIEYDLQPGDSWIRYKEDLSEQGKLLIESFFCGIELIADEYPDHVTLA